MAQWMVRSEGSAPIGPVSTELLLRGIAQGRVPVESEVQQLGTREWQVLEFVDAFADAIQSDEAMTRLAESPLDDADIIAYADAEEAFTQLAVPAGQSLGARPPPPPPAASSPRAASGPASARFPAPPKAANASYDEDDDAATRVASSPLSSSPLSAGGPPPIPAAAALSRPFPPEQALMQGPPAVIVQDTPAPPVPQPMQQAPIVMAPPPQQSSGSGLATGLLALLVLVLAGCLGLLLWMLSKQ
ncbi:MAG: hypothetical protein H6718_32730 [Polyangiaceae bacterium]|nr:hypothetical protein [Myxococcales bacterium]MCB9590224.1 hypothetical protein [Polyangiaceae bacterium]MCB9605121.1 hypothetical protein [Polyangiaceae bacterium]